MEDRVKAYQRVLFVVSLFVLGAGTLLAMTSLAEAHERRNVLSYTLVVGWLTEPAYVNIPNAVDLRVSRTADGTPVMGLEQTLKVEMTAEGKKTELAFRPRFNTPGAYDGRTYPTALGVYAFRIFGTIEGNQVNETFTAGPGTFGLVEEPAGFPNEVPLNQQLDESLNGLEQRIVDLESADSGDDADTAMAIGIAGVLLGLAGLAVGGFALMRKA
jgi:hypothetical protein